MTIKRHPTLNLSVSDDGYIVGPTGRMLKNRVSNCGYYRVVTYVNGKHKSVSVHRLVAETFLYKTGDVVNHKDGNKSNNRVDNLEWCSQSDNVKHALATGLIDPKKSGQTRTINGSGNGERNGRAKVTEAIVKEIRASRDRLRGEKPWIGYGISSAMYRNIKQYRNWRHVP